jgi:hypothetical protein
LLSKLDFALFNNCVTVFQHITFTLFDQINNIASVKMAYTLRVRTRPNYVEISDSESESESNIEGLEANWEKPGRRGRRSFSRRPRPEIGNFWETRNNAQSMITETPPSSVNEIATIVPETSINPEQSLPMETVPSSMNETSNVQQTSHNLEHSLMTEETPSATAGTSSRQPEIKHYKKTILAWLTTCKEIDEGTEVRYHDGEKPITGRIFNGAILCSCCDEEISVWKFEMHAESDNMQPYKRISVAKRKSFLQNILISKWLKEDEQKRRDMFMYAPIHDIVCLVCGKGEDEGGFINCTKCPSTYHRSCAFIQVIN